MKNKRFIAVIILDLLVFVCMCLGVSFSIFHVRFMGDYPGLVSLPLLMTFTGLSNVFVGLVCLACALYRLIRKEYSLPFALFIIKLLAVAEILIYKCGSHRSHHPYTDADDSRPKEQYAEASVKAKCQNTARPDNDQPRYHQFFLGDNIRNECGDHGKDQAEDGRKGHKELDACRRCGGKSLSYLCQYRSDPVRCHLDQRHGQYGGNE